MAAEPTPAAELALMAGELAALRTAAGAPYRLVPLPWPRARRGELSLLLSPSRPVPSSLSSLSASPPPLPNSSPVMFSITPITRAVTGYAAGNDARYAAIWRK